MANSIVNVPEVINNYNVYNTGNILVGITGAVTLPSLEAITEEIQGAGILGTYETAIPGHFGSMAQEVPFRILYSDIFSIMNPNELVDLTFRSSSQYTVKETGALGYEQVRIAERGRLKSFNPGSLELGKAMNASVTLELMYLLIEIAGETKLEYDKLNCVFTVDGVDLLEKVRSYC